MIYVKISATNTQYNIKAYLNKLITKLNLCSITNLSKKTQPFMQQEHQTLDEAKLSSTILYSKNIIKNPLSLRQCQTLVFCPLSDTLTHTLTSLLKSHQSQPCFFHYNNSIKMIRPTIVKI